MNRAFTSLLCAVALLFVACGCGEGGKIDRHALVTRNKPHLTALDTFGSLSVGNGEFAFTVDVTGLQTLPELYSKGVPLGTQSQWGWHSFPNPENYTPEDAMRDYDFGRGRMEPYSVQFNEKGHAQSAANWLRANPHRLHLGVIGFEGVKEEQLSAIDQTLDMWSGAIRSSFSVEGERVDVTTICQESNPQSGDVIAVQVKSKRAMPVAFRFPYPTGGHTDDACLWGADSLHSTTFEPFGEGGALITRTVDDTKKQILVTWKGDAQIEERGANYLA